MDQAVLQAACFIPVFYAGSQAQFFCAVEVVQGCVDWLELGLKIGRKESVGQGVLQSAKTADKGIKPLCDILFLIDLVQSEKHGIGL